MLAWAILPLHPAAGYDAEIARDKFGVPYVIAADLENAAFGDGWAQADDRYQRLLDNIQLATGTRAAAVGASALGSDKAARLTGARRAAYATFGSVPEATRRIITAFAAGVNAYGDAFPDRRPPNYRRIEPEEILAVAEFAFLARQLQQAKKDIKGATNEQDCGEGSNGVVLGPGRTRHGNVIIQVDPHTPWAGLNRWYEKGYVTPTVTAHGANATGLPLFAFATTDRIAWSMTRNAGDRGDCFRLTKGPGAKFVVDGVEHPLETITETIEIAGGSPITLTIRVARYTDAQGRFFSGPVFFEDATYFYAAGMSLFERVGALEQARGMLEADDLAAFEAAVDDMEWDGAQFFYGDSGAHHGDVRSHIAYGWLNRLLDREETLNGSPVDWQTCIDGSTAGAFYTGLYPYSGLPRSVDDPGDYYQGSNLPDWQLVGGAWGIDPDSFETWVVADDPFQYLPARAQRVVDLIGPAGTRASLARVRRNSVDSLVLAARWVIPLIDFTVTEKGDTTPLVQAALSELRRWQANPVARRSSRAFTIYHEWVGYYIRDAANAAVDPSPVPAQIREEYPELDPTITGRPPDPTVVSQLDRDRVYDAFVAAVNHLADYYDDGGSYAASPYYDSPRPRWGDVNYLPLTDAAGATVAAYAFGGGCSEVQTPWQASHGGGTCGAAPNEAPDGTWTANSGSSFMMSSELGPTPHVHTLVHWGQSDDPASPHFADQIERYLKGRYKHVPFSEGQVRQQARSILRVGGS